MCVCERERERERDLEGGRERGGGRGGRAGGGGAGFLLKTRSIQAIMCILSFMYMKAYMDVNI